LLHFHACFLILFLYIFFACQVQQTVKSPNEHGNTLGNQPAERYKLVDKKTGKPLKSGETTHGESRYGLVRLPYVS
jgi:hypothetical protein